MFQPKNVFHTGRFLVVHNLQLPFLVQLKALYKLSKYWWKLAKILARIVESKHKWIETIFAQSFALSKNYSK